MKVIAYTLLAASVAARIMAPYPSTITIPGQFMLTDGRVGPCVRTVVGEWTDKKGNTCAFYDTRPHRCGRRRANYGLTPSEACCVCNGNDDRFVDELGNCRSPYLLQAGEICYDYKEIGEECGGTAEAQICAPDSYCNHLSSDEIGVCVPDLCRDCTASQECQNTVRCITTPCPVRYECVDVGCTEDLRLCPDGSSLERDPLNACQFPACPSDNECKADAECAEFERCSEGQCVEFSCCSSEQPSCDAEEGIRCEWWEGAFCCSDGVWYPGIGGNGNDACGARNLLLSASCSTGEGLGLGEKCSGPGLFCEDGLECDTEGFCNLACCPPVLEINQPACRDCGLRG